MALSVIVYPGNGTQRQFAIPFSLGYLREEDVAARVGNEVDGTGAPLYRDLTFISPELVEVSGAAAPVGSVVRFTRTVDREQLLVDYEDGAIINEENMNTAQKQAIMLIQEALDGRFAAFQTDIDMNGFRFLNIGEPVDAGDASTKGYVDARISTGAVSAAAAAASAAAAAASASSANTARAQAQAAAVTATNAETVTTAAASAAAGSASAASTSASAAQASASSAQGSATAAGTSASNAATSATDAAASATVASTQATNAANAATSATGSATSALNSSTSALAYRDAAHKWAQENEDTLVDDGTHTGYSAFHWSKKAERDTTGGSVPIGTIIQVYGNGTDVPAGYLKVVPGLAITGAYPDFRAWAIRNGWSINGAGDPVFPATDDALFLRQWSSGQSRDAGRTFGSVQADAIVAHDHYITSSQGVAINTSVTIGGAGGASFTVVGGSGSKTSGPYYGTTSLAANETRPANITVTWFIKAYNAVDDVELVTAAAVVSKVQQLRVPTITTTAPTTGGQDGDIWYVI